MKGNYRITPVGFTNILQQKHGLFTLTVYLLETFNRNDLDVIGHRFRL